MFFADPWHDAICSLDDDNRAAFRAHAERCRSDCLATILDAPIATMRRSAVGVQINGEVRASLIFCIDLAPRNLELRRPRIMDVELAVEGGWRRLGLGTSLIHRATAIGRQIGANIVRFEAIPGEWATRRFARRIGAELTFDRQECQAWIELKPQPEKYMTTASKIMPAG